MNTFMKDRIKGWSITAMLTFLNLFACYAQSENSIEWKQNVLTPSSFTIIPDSTQTGREGAYTASKFLYHFRTKPASGDSMLVEFSVRNVFLKDDSWLKAALVEDHRLLKHEQAHFDLSEVYARKIAKAVSEARFSQDLKVALRSITLALSAELEKQQKIYDEQTEHGIKREKQATWRSFIDQELEKYSKYSNKRVVYTVKSI